MEVNYIVFIGDRAYECYNLADASSHFNITIPNDRRVICNGYRDTMNYSEEWNHHDLIVDFMKCRVTKVVPNVRIYRVRN